MQLQNSGLVLEGGGLRGIFTSGVLRYFMDRELYFPYVIGVSMGACNAVNYVARQPERNRIVNTRFLKESRYLSYRRLFLGGDLFGMDFIFDTIPNKLVPFDYDTFLASDTRLVIVATDCETGEALYYEKDDLGRDCLTVLRASSSLPFIARPVPFRGRTLMDGGLADSVPLERCLADGIRKAVLVLTREKGYRKKPSRFPVSSACAIPACRDSGGPWTRGGSSTMRPWTTSTGGRKRAKSSCSGLKPPSGRPGSSGTRTSSTKPTTPGTTRPESDMRIWKAF